jgi:hypothetical protein
MRARVVQRACVLLHFDERFAAELFDPDKPAPAWLESDELALLRRADPRGFRTDPERPLRLLAALLEELPVSCAIVGREALSGFLSSSVFRGAVLRGRLVVDAFGDWLLPRAGATAQLEQAIALARRRRQRRGPGIARAPGIELARVPVGTLAFYAEARARLGAAGAPHEAVARGARLSPPDEGAGGPGAGLEHPLEHLLVEMPPAARAAEGPAVGPCAGALFSLLAWAREGRARAALIEEARRLGADDAAAEVIDGLLDDGLLSPAPAPSGAAAV